MSLPIWVVYAHPADYPDWFVARRFILDKPTEVHMLGRTLEDVRSLIPEGLHRMPRMDGDEPQIVEVWL